MARFLTPVRLEIVDDKSWKVLSPILYESSIYSPIIVVPAGFITDLSSVPRLPFIFLLFGDSLKAAAVIHDYLYSIAKVPREICDKIFLEAAKVSTKSPVKAYCMYAAVRVFGWLFKKG